MSNGTCIFVIKDADTDLKAYLSTHDENGADKASAYVTVMSPGRDQFITMTVADFERLAAAVARQF